MSVRDAYLKVAQREPQRFSIIDADRPAALIGHDVAAAVDKLLRT